MKCTYERNELLGIRNPEALEKYTTRKKEIKITKTQSIAVSNEVTQQ